MEVHLEMISNIKQNLKNLDFVCEKFPILDSYRRGEVSSNSLYNLGLNDFVAFIDFLKRLENTGQKPYYEEKIKYSHLKKKLVELAPYEKSAKTFSRKSEEDFLLVMTNPKISRRYIRSNNLSYFSGLFKGEVIILNYLIQKLSELASDVNIQKIGDSTIYRHVLSTNACISKFEANTTIFSNYQYYNRILPLPKFRNLEFEMVDTFIDKFNETLGDFDFRKCNWNFLQNKILKNLENKFTVEKDSTIKALNDIEYRSKVLVEKDKLYQVINSSKNSDGFLNVTIIINGESYTFPYYNFEEISRLRDDLINQLFGDSGS